MATKKGFYKRGEVWWLRTDPVDGRPISTKCTSFEAAEQFRNRRELLAANPGYARSLEAELGDWCSRFVEMKRRDSSEANVVYCTGKLGPVLRFFSHECKLATIDAVKVDEYVAMRRDEGVAEVTLSREVRILIQVLKLAKRSQAYGGDLETLRPPDLHGTYVPRKRVLSPGEADALRAQVSRRAATLLDVGIALGCRRSEALKLEPGDVDLEKGIVHIRGTKTEGSDRVVPILSPFRSMLERALPSLPIGPDPNKYLNTDIRRACVKLAIPHVSPNDFRRTHVTWLLSAGVDRDVIRRLVGHTTTRLIDTVYGQPEPEALAALAEERLSRTSQSTQNVRELPSKRRVSPARLASAACSLFTPRCEKAAAIEVIATRTNRWKRVATSTFSLHGYWAGRKGRAA